MIVALMDTGRVRVLKHIWYQRALDILADQDPRPASDTLVGDYLACFGLTIERLLKTLEK